MNSKHVKGICITARDVALFEYLFAHRAATARQISRDFFGATDPRSVRRRLKLLRDNKYLTVEGVLEKTPKLGYRISRKTKGKYFSQRVKRQRTPVKGHSPSHNAIMAALRNRLNQIPQEVIDKADEAIRGMSEAPPPDKLKSTTGADLAVSEPSTRSSKNTI